MKKIEIIDQKVQDYLANVHFRHSIIGINKVDVWQVIQNVEKYYRKKMELNNAEKDAVIRTQSEELDKMRKLVAEVTNGNN